MTIPSPPHDRGGFEVAIICALPREANAVICLLDHVWDEYNHEYRKVCGDDNAYTTGIIGKHNVVVVHMPGTGKVNAAGAAASLRISFQNIRLALVAGICGGIPYDRQQKRNIYLGDVIISRSVIQYDCEGQYPDNLGNAPKIIRSTLAKLEVDYHLQSLQDNTLRNLRELQQKSRSAAQPEADSDLLFDKSYVHKHHKKKHCRICGNKDRAEICSDAKKMTCDDLKCSAHQGTRRERRMLNIEGTASTMTVTPTPSIHIGIIGSGDTVMKSGTHRDDIATRNGTIAFEMEGAGVWDFFPTIVIKGVCDYADSHKNDLWQDYAAATAAACVKAFLRIWVSDIRLENNRQHHMFLTEVDRLQIATGC